MHHRTLSSSNPLQAAAARLAALKAPISTPPVLSHITDMIMTHEL